MSQSEHSTHVRCLGRPCSPATPLCLDMKSPTFVCSPRLFLIRGVAQRSRSICFVGVFWFSAGQLSAPLLLPQTHLRSRPLRYRLFAHTRVTAASRAQPSAWTALPCHRLRLRRLTFRRSPQATRMTRNRRNRRVVSVEVSEVQRSYSQLSRTEQSKR